MGDPIDTKAHVHAVCAVVLIVARTEDVKVSVPPAVPSGSGRSEDTPSEVSEETAIDDNLDESTGDNEEDNQKMAGRNTWKGQHLASD